MLDLFRHPQPSQGAPCLNCLVSAWRRGHVLARTPLQRRHLGGQREPGDIRASKAGQLRLASALAVR
eukprot:1743999-Rhodomonas_salina.1